MKILERTFSTGKDSKEEHMYWQNKFNIIMMTFCAMLLATGCKDKKDSKKTGKAKVSAQEIKQRQAILQDLKERMQVVMETQDCILKNCSSFYAEKSREQVQDLNTQVVQVKAKKINPVQLQKLSAKVGAAEEVQVGLLKTSCKFCAQ